MLERVGLIGWERQELLILSALACRYPVMLIGKHGCNKTEGAKRLAQVVLGTEAKFQHYDTPLLTSEDFLGYPDPTSFHTGKVNFVPTPLSVWDKDAILLDEPNRASPFVAAKIMELARTRRVMGAETSVKLVFGAINPPAEYEAVFFNLAAASRFVYVQVPDAASLGDAELDTILDLTAETEINAEAAEEIRVLIEQARQLAFSDEARNNVKRVTKAIMRRLLGTEVLPEQEAGKQRRGRRSPDEDPSAINRAPRINFQPRQAQMLFGMLMAAEAFRVLGVRSDEEKLSNIAMSCIPQIHGVTVTTDVIDPAVVRTSITTLLVGFSLGDPIMSGANPVELIDAFQGLTVPWTAAFKQSLAQLRTVKDLWPVTAAWRAKTVSRDAKNSVTKLIMDRAVQLAATTMPDELRHMPMTMNDMPRFWTKLLSGTT